ncbi:MAG: oligosaccharide flippase family protein, partial [Candidatus Riflebacteria bacterium]|nr:oligosaccharide flippase family protein [Candidatus Riflebacteria bacterium]
MVTTVIIILITVFYADSIFIILKYESLIPYKWFIPVFVLFQGFYKTFNYWNSRTKRFDGIALAGVLNSSSTRIINLISGLSGNTSNTAMIGAYTAGQVVATSTIGLQILNKDSGYLKSNFKINKILEVLKRYKKFPLIDIWSALLNTLSINLPSFILTYYFNSTIVGFFSFGHRVLTFPISLIGNSMSQVYFQRSAEAKHDGTLAELTENLFKLLCEISISPMFIFMMIAPDLFSLAFGLKWYDAGVYARILAPWTLGVFICSPLSSVVSTLEKQEIGLFMNILLLATRAV